MIITDLENLAAGTIHLFFEGPSSPLDIICKYEEEEGN